MAKIQSGANSLQLDGNTLTVDGAQGIVRIAYTMDCAEASASTLILKPWPAQALEGCVFTPSAGSSLNFDDEGLIDFSFDSGNCTILFGDEAAGILGRGGVLSLIDRYR